MGGRLGFIKGGSDGTLPIRQLSAQCGQDSNAAVLQFQNIGQIDLGDLLGVNVSNVLAGKRQVGGQQPFAAAIQFDLQDGDAGQGHRL